MGFFDTVKGFNERHERLKKYVHTAWRVPLPKWGQVVMSCIYFTVPVIGGYQVMQWAISKSHESIGERGEKLRIKHVEGLGDKTPNYNKNYNADGSQGEGQPALTKIGAGGVGMGVKLAVSDSDDQMRSKKMLEKFLKREARKKRLREEKEKEGK